MGQNYQPDYDKVMQGESQQASDEDTLAAIRKILTDEEVEHPEVMREAAERKSWTSTFQPARRPARAAGGSLASRLLGRLRA